MRPHTLCVSSAVARRLLLCLSLCASAACAGCGDDWQADTYPARGRLTINGQPATGAVVTLHPLGEPVDVRRSNPWAVVQPDGAFALSTYQQGDGAPEGEYSVTVKWPADVTNIAAAMSDRLGGAYAAPQQSPWKVSVSPGENELPPLEIAGAKVLSKEQAQASPQAPPGTGLPR